MIRSRAFGILAILFQPRLLAKPYTPFSAFASRIRSESASFNDLCCLMSGTPYTTLNANHSVLSFYSLGILRTRLDRGLEVLCVSQSQCSILLFLISRPGERTLLGEQEAVALLESNTVAMSSGQHYALTAKLSDVLQAYREYLSSGEKRAGCADLVTSPSTTFWRV